MSVLTKARRCELLAALVAMAEEREGVALGDAADELGVDEATLHDVLSPLLVLEYEPPDEAGAVVSLAYAFELGEDGVLSVAEEHWLRDLDARPPHPDVALRLFVAGTLLARELRTEPGGLEEAMAKLASVMGAPVVVETAPPPLLGLVRDAARRRRTLLARYAKADGSDARDREIEVHRVFQRWGRWYLVGRDVGTQELKHFRVDRIVRAELGDRRVEPIEDVDAPEWFDLDERQMAVRVEVSAVDLALLRAVFRVDAVEEAGPERHRVELAVFPGAQLDYLLLRLHPDAVVLAPPELAARRRDAARHVLACYE